MQVKKTVRISYTLKKKKKVKNTSPHHIAQILKWQFVLALVVLHLHRQKKEQKEKKRQENVHTCRQPLDETLMSTKQSKSESGSRGEVNIFVCKSK